MNLKWSNVGLYCAQLVCFLNTGAFVIKKERKEVDMRRTKPMICGPEVPPTNISQHPMIVSSTYIVNVY